MIWSILALSITLLLVIVYEIRLTRAYREADAFKQFYHDEADLTKELSEEVGYLRWQLEDKPLRLTALPPRPIQRPDPKDEGYHSHHADLWDMREGK